MRVLQITSQKCEPQAFVMIDSGFDPGRRTLERTSDQVEQQVKTDQTCRTGPQNVCHCLGLRREYFAIGPSMTDVDFKLFP